MLLRLVFPCIFAVIAVGLKLTDLYRLPSMRCFG